MNNIIDDLYLGNINPNELTRIVHVGYKRLAKENEHNWAIFPL